jgi:Fe(3+) dicitrate transport protein
MIINKGRSILRASVLLTCTFIANAPARGEDSLTLPEIQVTGSRESWRQSLSPVVSESGQANLKKGKKVIVIESEAAPIAPTNNFRYQFARTPGIMVSEVNNESFSSMSVRGLGDPHESQNLLFLEDGVPLAADLYGYGANYYQPPAEWVERTEFYRGGAGLTFGPMPGGAVSYRLRAPKTGEAFKLWSGFRNGSFNTNTYSLGTQIPVSEQDAVLIEGQRRSSDGFRQSNSRYDIAQARMNWLHAFKKGETLSLSAHVFGSTHGEPGGLASASGDRSVTTTPNDRLELGRTFGSLEYRNETRQGLLLTSQLYGGVFERNSFRQNLGTSTQFGGTPNAFSNTIQKQKFTTLASDTRAKWDHHFLAERNTLSAGVLLYAVDSPFIQELGASPTADTGTSQKNLDRKTRTVSLHVEERFEWGKTSVTPGIRIENIYQSIRENLNVGGTAPLRNSSEWAHVPLFGLGVETRVAKTQEAYFNLSQSYRPMAFQDTVPLQTGDLISEDLKPAKAWTLEAGLRDRWSERLTWDVSAFLISYSDQFGRVGNVLQNTGAAVHQGVEASYDLELFRGTLDLHWVGNLTGLHARYKEGALSGKTPQYAPKWMFKNGLYSNLGSRLKTSLLHTFVSDHFGDDGNSLNRRIPTYRVVDLTVEGRIPRTGLTVFAGVFNLLDESYFSRVRSNGIEPAMPRNFSIGLSAGI